MYKTRSLKFKHGRMCTDGLHVDKLNEISRFTDYIIKLCNESNKITKTKLIGVKADSYDNWVIKIKTKNKDYFNIIVQRFINYFGSVISEIKF